MLLSTSSSSRDLLFTQYEYNSRNGLQYEKMSPKCSIYILSESNGTPDVSDFTRSDIRWKGVKCRKPGDIVAL